MRTGLKPFVKVLHLADTAISSISFQDSAGTVLPSNYFSVQCRNLSSTVTTQNPSGDTGDFFIVPSSVGGNTMYGTTVHASATTDSGPGAGGVAGTADSTVEMSLVPPDRIGGITVHNQLGSSGRFVITYGNLRSVNKNRDANDTLYPKGA